MPENQIASLFREIADALRRGGDQSELLEVVCNAIRQHLELSFVGIWTTEAASKISRCQASSGLEFSEQFDLLADRVRREEKIIQADPKRLAVLGFDSKWIQTTGIGRLAAFPIVNENVFLGVICICSSVTIPDLTIETVDAVGSIIAGVMDRHRLQREMQTFGQHYRTMIGQVSDYAVFMTDADARAVTWNEGVHQVLGFSESEFIGTDVKQAIFTDEAKLKGIPDWEFETAAESGSCSDDRWMRRSDGTTFWASGITTAIFDDHDNLIGFNKIMRDLTHRKDADDAIRQLNAELSQNDRRKNQFLATLAHELRNPLTPISSALELMKDVEDPSHEIAELRELAQRQVVQMIRLVDDLLDLSRISRGSISIRAVDCRLQPVIQQAIETANPFIAESNHVMVLNVPEDPIYVYGDPARLAQIVTNLLNNAAKYTPADGRIELTLAADGRDVRLSVNDNGIGIEKENLSTVFDMFAQADVSLERGKSGLGIGLALVKTLVELHGGTIEITSQGRDRGTQVTVKMKQLDITSVDRESDLRESSADIDETNREIGIVVTPRRRRVLVVDDVQAITVTLGRLIGKLGHDVETASSGREALDKIPEFEPEIIFSDISMPEMNGYELAAECRNKHAARKLVIVAMTGFGQEADRKRALSAGFDHHMVKPPDVRDLQKYFELLNSSSIVVS